MIMGVISLAFLILAVPFIALTVMHLLSGGSAAPNTLYVLGAYLLVTGALVIFWIRQLRRRSPPGDSSSRSGWRGWWP
ncbi:MAG: hypothetical protein KGQ88_08585 [Chloroflexi bacterium]|nr:hypothetical protein [Chloroflexota bacterium]